MCDVRAPSRVEPQYSSLESESCRWKKSLSHLRHLASAVLAAPSLALAPDLREDLLVRTHSMPCHRESASVRVTASRFWRA